MMINYELKRSRGKKMSLAVKGEKVVVRAPFFVPKKIIENFVNENSEFVSNAIKHALSEKKHYEVGDQIMYLGKKYFISHDIEAIRTKKSDNKIILGLKVYSPRESWLKFIKDETSRIIYKILAEFAQFDTKNLKINVKLYQSKWGSCSSKSLSFNQKLAMAPVEVIRYVVIHELCHIAIKNHSREFYKQVEKLDNNYRVHRRWFRDNAKELNI